VTTEFSLEFKAFMKANGIRHCIIDMQGTKKVAIPDAIMNSIMEVTLNKENHPLLIHCNHGKVFTTAISTEAKTDRTIAQNWLRSGSHTACVWLEC